MEEETSPRLPGDGEWEAVSAEAFWAHYMKDSPWSWAAYGNTHLLPLGEAGRNTSQLRSNRNPGGEKSYINMQED